ncbi:cytochrome c oxidase subunit 5b-1, mitochondrial-like [Typha latifolia]|uniref:cytochrome c oxidase subunit 5b-1, mitochondrial-like n=1 Tax=Typha latifolia TaxID=4733 RepID=UPI003C2C4D9F
MWRSASSLASCRSTLHREALRRRNFLSSAASLSAFRRTSPLLSSESSAAPARRAEDVKPITTGHEREEVEGRKRLDMDLPVGPFGTKLNVIGEGGPPDGHGDDDHH